MEPTLANRRYGYAAWCEAVRNFRTAVFVS